MPDPAALQMIFVAAVLVGAVLLFVTERLPFDVVALLVLVTLVVGGAVEPQAAVAGFGNPAVVTIGAVFVVSGGLARTGIANLIGRYLLRFAGDREVPLVAVIMVAVGGLSGFMNDIGVAALMLPVVMDIARRTGRPPSKLLIPLSFAALMGGKMTLIGTAANLLLSNALVDAGLAPFSLFDFAPLGLVAMFAGILFMVGVGHRLLPSREGYGTESPATDLADRYDLGDRLHFVRIPEGSPLDRTPLAKSRLGSALDLNVVAIIREGRLQAAPTPKSILREEDRLLVEGELDRFREMAGTMHLVRGKPLIEAEDLAAHGFTTGLALVAADAPIVGRTLLETHFRQRYGVLVLAIRRGESLYRTNLEHVRIQAGDGLLVEGRSDAVDALSDRESFQRVTRVPSDALESEFHLDERLIPLRVPPRSALVGRTLEETRLGDAFGVGVMGIVRDGEVQMMLPPDERLRAGDTLLVKARPEDLAIGRGLIGLRAERDGGMPEIEDMADAGVGLMEVVLSPHSRLDGLTPREIGFRDRYGVSLLAVSRGGEVLDTDRRDLAIHFGDALLVFGPLPKLNALGSEPDFLALTESAQEATLDDKAPVAAGILAVMLLVVIAGWLPISIASLAAAGAMIIAGCLSTREAYRAIEWPAIVLVAGMLPLGLAMSDSGLAQLIARGVIGAVGDMGPWAVMAAVFWMTVAAAQIIPTAVVAVLLAPIVINAAQTLALSPHAMLMLMAMAVSSSFMTPVGHPVNVLVMGPGGYKFSDYARVGFPLTLVIFVAVMLAMPLFWPVSVVTVP